MRELFDSYVSAQVEPELLTLGLRLLLAWFCGWIVALLARRNKPPGAPDSLALTLILMSILIAMATQIIGDNIARAFSLVGALSIVRFRTAVPATRDVAFVLAAVVVGMAIGAGQYWVAGLGIIVIGLATRVNSPSHQDFDGTAGTKSENLKSWRITIRVGLSDTKGWEPELNRLSESIQLMSVETTRRASALELVYRIIPNPEFSAVDVIAALNSIPAVESVAAKAT